ncbi:MAG: ion channel [Nanoarchaeota archaeon]|nr:ion channel [Nanoarchaeota archaeon]
MRRNADLGMLSFLTIFAFTGGSLFYHTIEGWSWLDSIYFSVITLTTVGYGDFVPTTAVSKIFTMFYVFIGVGIIFGFIHAVAKRALRRAKRSGMEAEKQKIELEEQEAKIKAEKRIIRKAKRKVTRRTRK